MDKIWFKRKKYGWGWFPSTWQGWVAITVFLALVTGPTLKPKLIEEHVVIYLIYVSLVSAGLVGLCWLFGERPRWQWGNQELPKE